jgi:uncharacterized membrane protein (UPF0127 family)
MVDSTMGLKTENGDIVCAKVKLASNIDERMLGLMFKKEMPGCDGLLIAPCTSIHTFFMKMNIDVIFMDRNFKIVKLIYNMKPWRMTLISFRSYQVLEMKAGTLSNKLSIGQVLRSYV